MDSVAAIVRLSHKYQIDALLQQGLAHLRELYTDDFDEWIKPEGERERAISLRAKPVDAIVAVNIAHFTGATSLLPVAYLECCRAGSEILYGRPMDHGLAEYLTGADIARIMDGRVRLMQASVRGALRIFRAEESPRCVSISRCEAYLRSKMLALHEYAEGIASCGVNETWLQAFAPEEEYEGREVLCSQCWAMIKRRDLDARRAIWKKLPSLFGLNIEGWAANVADVEDWELL